VIEVKNNQQEVFFSYYPNPVKDNIILQLQSNDMGPVYIRLISVDGGIVMQQ
jgi:hypothetical protein